MDIDPTPVGFSSQPNLSPPSHSPSHFVARFHLSAEENGLVVDAPVSGHRRSTAPGPQSNDTPPIPVCVPAASQAVAGGEKGEGVARPKHGCPPCSTRVHVGMRVSNWIVVSRIGAGSFGEAFAAINIKDLPPSLAPLGDASTLPPLLETSTESSGAPSPPPPSEEEIARWLECLPPSSERREYCLKVEQVSKKSVLRLEALSLKRVQSCSQVVRYLGSGATGGIHFLVMEKLGPDLAKLRRYAPGGKFNIYTTLRVGISCLRAICEVHEQGLVHRDIKPSNFIIGLPGTARCRVCYLIDFGLARRFRRSSGELREARAYPGFHGTSRYASVASHHHQELGRVDDLWSLLFMLIEFATGTLPWRKYKTKEDIALCKEASLKPKLVRNLPREFQTFLSHLQSLKYEDEPDYKLLLSCLYCAIERRQYPEDMPLDWEVFLSSENSGELGIEGEKERKALHKVEDAVPIPNNVSKDENVGLKERERGRLSLHNRDCRGGAEQEDRNHEEHHREEGRSSHLHKTAEIPDTTEGASPGIFVSTTPHERKPEGDGLKENKGGRIQEEPLESLGKVELPLEKKTEGSLPSRKIPHPVHTTLIESSENRGRGQGDAASTLDAQKPHSSAVYHEEAVEKERRRYGAIGVPQGHSSEKWADDDCRRHNNNANVDVNSDENDEDHLNAAFSPFERLSSTRHHVEVLNNAGSSAPHGGNRSQRRPKGGQASHQNHQHYDANDMDANEIPRHHTQRGGRNDGDSPTFLGGTPGYPAGSDIGGAQGSTGFTDMGGRKKGTRRQDVEGGPYALDEEKAHERFGTLSSGGIASSAGLAGFQNPSKGREEGGDDQGRMPANPQSQQNGLTSMPLPVPSNNSGAAAPPCPRKSRHDRLNCVCLVC